MQFSQTNNSSAWGVCSAIAEFYGFTSPIRLFTSLGLPAPRKWYLYTQDQVELLFANERIADDMKCSGMFNGVPLVSVFERKVHSHHLKVCRHCLSEGTLHDIGWQAIETTVCGKHHAPLVNSCVHMYAEENWKDGMRCKGCNVEMPATVSSPAYQRYLQSLDSDLERQAFVSTLKAVTERMVRPFDFIPSTIRWAKLSPKKVQDLLEDAFKLGTNPSTTETWLEMVLNHRSGLELLGQSAMNIELVSLQATLSRVCWSNKVINQDRFEPSQILTQYHESPIPEDVIAAKNRYQYCQDPENFSFMITGVSAASLLGVHPKAITELMATGTLRAIHNCKQPDKQLFDIREVRELLFGKATDQPKPSNDFISVDDIPSAIYELYDLTPELLVQKALSANIDAQIRVNSTLRYVNNLQVASDGLKSLLKQAWESLQDCPIKKAAKMLRTNTQIIEKLIERGFLTLLPNDQNLIEATTIQDFVNEYLLVNRKATFHQARNIALKISACCDVEPVFSMYMNPTKTDFVVFRKSELSPCCMQNVPKRFAHFTTPRVDLSKNVHLLFTRFSSDSNEQRYF